MAQIEQLAILISALVLILPYGELALHKYELYRLAKKEGDGETAVSVQNEMFMAAGIAGAGVWLLLVVFIGDGSHLATVIFIGLLLLGCLSAVALYVRMRFRK